MSRLDRDDRVRELRFVLEMASLLTSSDPWKWFESLIDAEVDVVKARVMTGLSVDEYCESVGVYAGLKRALTVVDRAATIAKAELESLGVNG